MVCSLGESGIPKKGTQRFYNKKDGGIQRTCDLERSAKRYEYARRNTEVLLSVERLFLPFILFL